MILTGAYLVYGCVVFLTGILLTGLTPAKTKFQVTDSIYIFQESFILHTPSKGCRREETPALSVCKTARTVITGGKGEKITVKKRIIGTSIPADKINLASPILCRRAVYCSGFRSTIVIITLIGRRIIVFEPFSTPIFHVVIFVTHHHIQMMCLVEIFVVLGVCRSNQVVFLFLVLAYTSIIEAISRIRIVVSIFSTIGIFTRKIHMQTQVFKSMYLIIGFKITEKYGSALIECIMINQFHRIFRSIIIACKRESGVVFGSILCPLPITAPILELFVLTHYRTSRVHRDSCTDSIRTTRICLGVRILGIDVKIKMIIQQ